MAAFEGFQPNSQKTAIPNVFFTRLMPLIKDAGELKIALHVFWALQQKKGSPRFVTFRELLGDKTLAPSLGEDITERVEALEKGLRGAVEKGILITTEVEAEGLRHGLYFLNTESDRMTLGRIARRELDLGGVPVAVADPEVGLPPNVFAVYENNIGPLTPIIVEELKRAESLYPENWIVEAIHEAAKNSARSWTYIEAILKNRREEGKTLISTESQDLSLLYRKNIGRVTPIIMEELQLASTLYPEEWIVDAIHDAVRNSAPSWAYILAILKSREERGESVEGTDLDNLIAVYKSNIGPLTRVIVTELKNAATLYPEDWIVDAIGEAVKNSARSWTYVEAILKNWRTEGRTSGKAGRHTGSTEDTEKYFKGRYGHLVKGNFD